VKIIKDPKEMHQFAFKAKARGKTIALVPTMGYLHEGHLSLIGAARAKADILVVSIFINPTQFSPSDDLASYPRDLKHDLKQLKNFEVDILFTPTTEQIYNPDHKTFIDVTGLAKRLCGVSRPSHFRGVATIVAKLFNLVLPDFAFFGEKDYQQQLIIKAMARDLNFPIEVISLPIVREYDGLAMSSRNKYLAAKEREQATILYKALCVAKEEIEKGEQNVHKVLFKMRSLIGTNPSIRLDYAAIVNPETLEEAKNLKGRVLVAIAAHLGKARLIDNLIIEGK
jgi:pantoate--beta-alanine ligase